MAINENENRKKILICLYTTTWSERHLLDYFLFFILYLFRFLYCIKIDEGREIIYK